MGGLCPEGADYEAWTLWAINAAAVSGAGMPPGSSVAFEEPGSQASNPEHLDRSSRTGREASSGAVARRAAARKAL